MNKIKELRKEKNITVAELAKELGISQSMLTNYENGNGTPTTLEINLYYPTYYLHNNSKPFRTVTIEYNKKE